MNSSTELGSNLRASHLVGKHFTTLPKLYCPFFCYTLRQYLAKFPRLRKLVIFLPQSLMCNWIIGICATTTSLICTFFSFF